MIEKTSILGYLCWTSNVEWWMLLWNQEQNSPTKNGHLKATKETLKMGDNQDSVVGQSITNGLQQPIQGQPDAWTLFREGSVQPLFALQKHMPEITVGRSTDCTLSCPGRINYYYSLIRNQNKF